MILTFSRSATDSLTLILPLADFVNAFLGFLMFFLSLFLILLVLIQRGKGGGLTGALGGPGGQSAFGSKAGDTFTVITVVVACVWGLICAITMWRNNPAANTFADAPETNLQAGPGLDDQEINDITSGLIQPVEESNGEPSDGQPALNASGAAESSDEESVQSMLEALQPAKSDESADASPTAGDGTVDNQSPDNSGAGQSVEGAGETSAAGVDAKTGGDSSATDNVDSDSSGDAATESP